MPRLSENQQQINEAELEPGYVICSECDGTGGFQKNRLDPKYHYYVCTKCWGEGKLDWIENVMGKQPEWTSKSVSSSSCSSSVSPGVSLIKKYEYETRRRNYEHNSSKHNNSTRRRTIQRFCKVFNKSKRSM
ncbi:hypothetical protein KAR91_65060 [Candidatus Pacearchaeota archaeon]|nr:hypothetical protein [Candidatus Pacearchaeota archaeon]